MTNPFNKDHRWPNQSQQTNRESTKARKADKKNPLNTDTPTKDAHQKSDVDSSNSAQHHTLGYNAGQAAPGTDLLALEARVADIEARLLAAGIP